METIAVGAFTIAGVVLGALLSNRFDRSGARRATALETRLRIAELNDFIWGDQPHARLVIETEKLRAQLEWLGVDSEKIGLLVDAAFECWSDGNQSLENGGAPGGGPGLSTRLLDSFRAACAEITATLPK